MNQTELEKQTRKIVYKLEAVEVEGGCTIYEYEDVIQELLSLIEIERKEAVGGFVKDAWDILEDIPHSEIMKDEAGNNIEITHTLEYRYQLALEQYLTQTKGGKE